MPILSFNPATGLSIIIKIILVVLLLGCLLAMPYGYYQFVRFASFVGFGILAYHAWQKQQPAIAFFYAAMSILFQPFVKIALGRTIWNIVDVCLAVFLIGTIIYERRPRSAKTVSSQ